MRRIMAIIYVVMNQYIKIYWASTYTFIRQRSQHIFILSSISVKMYHELNSNSLFSFLWKTHEENVPYAMFGLKILKQLSFLLFKCKSYRTHLHKEFYHLFELKVLGELPDSAWKGTTAWPPWVTFPLKTANQTLYIFLNFHIKNKTEGFVFLQENYLL